jgi:hypothetical protein
MLQTYAYSVLCDTMCELSGECHIGKVGVEQMPPTSYDVIRDD